MCVFILVPYVCPHAGMCVLMRLYTFPHTSYLIVKFANSRASPAQEYASTTFSTTIFLSSYFHVCPHAATYVSSCLIERSATTPELSLYTSTQKSTLVHKLSAYTRYTLVHKLSAYTRCTKKCTLHSCAKEHASTRSTQKSKLMRTHIAV